MIHTLTTPTGKRITHALERATIIRQIEGVERPRYGRGIIPVYANDAETVPGELLDAVEIKGQPVYMDENGQVWREDQLRLDVCPICDGTGEVVPVGAVKSRDWPDEPGSYPVIACPDCRGTGGWHDTE